MRIALRHIGARMTQQLLYLVQAHAVLDQKAGVGMAKIMDTYVIDPHSGTCAGKRYLKIVVRFPRARIFDKEGVKGRRLAKRLGCVADCNDYVF